MTSPQESSPPPPPHREVTLAAVFFGIFIGAVMNASLMYAALKIGFGIGGSTIAAILGFGFLRGILRKGTILETNITQTVASAVNTTFAGVVFTVPVLYLLDKQLPLSLGSSDFWLLAAACVIGALLGGVFIIPLRKQMVEIDRLRFPTGTAVAEILKSPGAGSKKAIALCTGVVLGALFYLPSGLPSISVTVPDTKKIEKLQKDPVAWRKTQEEAVKNLQEKENLAQEFDFSNFEESLASLGAAELTALEEYLPTKREPIWRGYELLNWRVTADEPPQEPEQPEDSATEQEKANYESSLAAYKEEKKAYQKYLTENDLDRDEDGEADLIMGVEKLDIGRWLGLPPEFLLMFAISPLSLAAGFITGRAGLMVLAGGILAYFVINPIAYNHLDLMPAATLPYEVPATGLSLFNRPLGIGLLLGGAMMGVLFSIPAMKAALRSISASRHQKGGSDELGMGFLAIAVAVGVIGLFVVNLMIGQGETGWLAGLHPVLASAMLALVGGVWIWFAGIIISQCTGMTDWSPISGISLLTVILVLLFGGADNVLGAVMLGAALCVSVSGAADMIQDLKTGQLVGSTPKKQQRIELAVMGLGPVISLCVLLLIVQTNRKITGEQAVAAADKKAAAMAEEGKTMTEAARAEFIADNTVPIGPGTPTTAPQAQAIEAVIKGVSGGDYRLSPSHDPPKVAEDAEVEPAMPYALYSCGAIVGGLLGLGGFPGLGVLVGLSMYLPIYYILTYGVGCVIYMIVARVKGKGWAEGWGVPLCAGLIVGEALTVLVVSSVNLGQGVHWGTLWPF